MKKNIFTLLLIAFSFTCIVSFAQNASGQNRDVSDFSSIASSGPFNVYIKLGSTESLKLDVEGGSADEIETTVENGTLKIQFKKEYKWQEHHFTKADVYITAKALKALVNSGSGSMKVDGTIDAQNLSVVLSGSGNITSNIKSNELHAVISGSGSITMSGNTGDASVVINGSGQLRGRELDTRNTTAVISGSGNVYVKASDAITARLVGSGSVIYTGNAKVETHTVGSGRVTKAN